MTREVLDEALPTTLLDMRLVRGKETHQQILLAAVCHGGREASANGQHEQSWRVKHAPTVSTRKSWRAQWWVSTRSRGARSGGWSAVRARVTAYREICLTMKRLWMAAPPPPLSPPPVGLATR